MSSMPLLALIARCRTLARPRSHAPDAELLARFAQERNVAAFEELLERHAPLVWGVCRRIAGSETDAEDAFQATFLALVRQANRLHGRQPLGAWLHTVAMRVARKGRAARLDTPAEPLERTTAGDVADEVGSRELCRIVDEEIERLPSALRTPLILCCLEGRTRDEAAALLGCSVSAVKGRLERGREMLRQRLKQRGVQLPLAFLTLTLTSERIRAVLWAKTMQTALYTPAPAIVALAEAAIPAMTAAKYKIAAVLMLLVMGTAGALGHVLRAKPQATPEPQAKAVAEPKKPQAPPVRTDRYGDPLPDGAIARLGTVRWRHGVFVHALAYSPDGKKIVSTGSSDRALVLWDAGTGKEIRQFASCGQPRGVAFSPDGKWIATTHRTGELWDVASGKMLRALNNPQFEVNALAFAPDGKTLATANTDGAVHLWDAASGAEKCRLNGGQDGLYALAYSSDGLKLAAGGKDGVICLWDVATAKEIRRLENPKKDIRCLVFSPDGKQLAVWSNEDSLRLWDVATGRQIRAVGEKQRLFASMPLAFSPDGKRLASANLDGTLRLWDAASGEPKRQWRAGSVGGFSLAFSPDGKTLATAVQMDGVLRLWDAATGGERHPSEGHHGPVSLLRFEPDNRTLISGGWNRRLLWWDGATQRPRRQFAWTTENHPRVFTLSADGNTLAVADWKTHEIWLWDTRGGKATRLSGKHEDRIETLAFSPDGRLVASGGADPFLRIWDVRQGKEIQQIKGFAGVVAVLRFSPDGKALACGLSPRRNAAAGESTLRLWDVSSGKERCTFASRFAVESALAFSPDGKVLASGGDDQSIRLWDAANGKALGRYTGHRLEIAAAAFSPDGKLVVSGTGRPGYFGDSSVHVWEAATGRPIRRFEGHHSWVWSVAFAPDGLTVASGAGDSTILLWDITGKRPEGHWHKKPLTPPQLDACWSALANEDAAKAYNAVWMLIATPEQAVPFLRKHLTPVPRPDVKAVSRHIADLDSENFVIRQRATEELSKLGDTITAALQKGLADKPSLEMRRRIQQLLDRARDWTAERLRVHRAIQALEHMNSRSAQELLQALAEGAPATQRTKEAKEALRRLKR
jgi:RNA polymerase sigma factor (sigma-70 family)